MNKQSLIELRDKFIDGLKSAVKNAKTEEEMVELGELVEDLLDCVPNEILLKDYWGRDAISRLFAKPVSKEQLDSIMNILWERDYVQLDYEAMRWDIDDIVDEVVGDADGDDAIQEVINS